MRNILFLILIFCKVGFCQDTSKAVSVGLNSYLVYSKHQSNDPNISLVGSYKIHSLYLGVSFVNGVDPAQTSALKGFQMGYQIFPNGRKRRFDLFFEYHFDYIKANFILHDNYSYHEYTNNSYKTYLVNWSTQVISYNHYIGYGFNLNFLKIFYLTSSFELGASWYDEAYNIETVDGLVLHKDRLDASMDLGLFLKFGIGCDVWKIKRN